MRSCGFNMPKISGMVKGHGALRELGEVVTMIVVLTDVIVIGVKGVIVIMVVIVSAIAVVIVTVAAMSDGTMAAAEATMTIGTIPRVMVTDSNPMIHVA